MYALCRRVDRVLARPKALRVTQPHGAQRSTYFLQLPYRYSIVLLTTSTLLHWLVSQCLFLANVNVFFPSGELDCLNSIATIGHSVVPLLFVLILGSVTVAVGFLNGRRRYRPGIPLAGSCSAAISAACHAPDEDVDAVESCCCGASFLLSRRMELWDTALLQAWKLNCLWRGKIILA